MTLAHTTRTHQPVTRYAAYYGEHDTVLYGTAELLVGYGWLFRADDGSWFEVMTPAEVMRGKLELFGLKEMADAQYALDRATRATAS